MKLQHLFSILPGIPEDAFTHVEVTGVFNDARQVVPGSVFVAIRGTSIDGHKFIPDAIAKGAGVLVVEEDANIPPQFTGKVIKVADTRSALDLLASRFYWDPGQELFCVGITGTNGKTSVAYMVEAVLNLGNMPTGVIGTVNHHLGKTVWPSDMTTPDPVFLQKRLREFRNAGAASVALEVSSHALDQKRVESVPFNTVVFTNLTRDHLDYHKTMDSYLEAKQRLFTDMLWKTHKRPCFAIININDRYGRRLKVADPAVLWTFGSKDADLNYQIQSMGFSLTVFALKTPKGDALVKLPMSGEHNVQNAVAAIGVGLSAGLSLDVCVKAIESFSGVPGRLEAVLNSKDIAVFVDYAHSPDALENVLGALRRVRKALESEAKIWTVFGCGGDRDKGKRSLMGSLAEEYSNHVVITSDNPRTENPDAIISEILAGVKNVNAVKVIPDRKAAIHYAIVNAVPGDVVLIAGKGHEDYQIIGTEKLYFSDSKAAEEALKER